MNRAALARTDHVRNGSAFKHYTEDGEEGPFCFKARCNEHDWDGPARGSLADAFMDMCDHDSQVNW